LDAPQVTDKDGILKLLAAFAVGRFHNTFDPANGRFIEGSDTPEAQRRVAEGYEWMRQTSTAVRMGCPVYTRLAADPSVRIRSAALDLLIVTCGGDIQSLAHVTDMIRARLTDERSRVLRIRLLDGLTRVGAVDEETISLVFRIFASTKDAALRLAAAVALAGGQGSIADPSVEHVLLQSLLTPDPQVIRRYTRGVSGGANWVDPVSSVSLALRQLGEKSAARTQDRLLDALAAQCDTPDEHLLPQPGKQSVPYLLPDGTMYWREIEGRFEYPLPLVLNLAKALLFLACGAHSTDRILPPHLRAIPLLAESQRPVIAGMVECEALWVYDRNMDWMLDLHQLPVTRESLRALLTN
jgi:hypothetical protein